MEVLGFVSAVIGLIAAIINRKQIVIVQADDRNSQHAVQAVAERQVKSPTTIGKRLKRAVLAFVVGFVTTGIAVESSAKGDLNDGVGFFVGVCMMVTMYQLAAIVVMILYKIWK